MFGAAAPAGAATESFALSSASVSGQSSVTWQGPPVNPPSTPNPFPDATSPITLAGQIDPSGGAISGARLSVPPIGIVGQGVQTYFAFSDSGKATGNFNSSTDAVTLNDTLTLTFTAPGAGITCVSTPITVALSGTWDSATENVTLAASGFTIPQFPASSGTKCSLAAASLNASPGGTAGAVGNAMSLALHGQFTPGLPTTTTLAATPNSPQLQGTAVTLHATVAPASGSGTPTGTVTFLDNGASLGTGTLSDGTAALTTSSLPAGTKQQLTATYSGDTTYASSTSSAVPYTITALPTVAPTLPGSITVPTAAQQPTVTSVSPDGGPAQGGTKVTITGTGFLPTSSVDFASNPATNVQFGSSTSLTATSPAGTGTVDVTVTTSAGTSPTSVSDVFAYATPTVTGVSPNNGPAGQSFADVMITGTGFTPSATVDFGSSPAGSVTVESPTLIEAYTPTGDAGTVDVTVSTPAGTSATSSADHYTYSSAPAVQYIRPAAGPPVGGTSVDIEGFNFTGATAVNFGSTAATSFTVASSSEIVATSPAGTSGTSVDVTVTTSAGTSAKWLYDQFTYGPPTVTAVSPSGGPAAGGTVVTVTGTGFAPSAVGKPTVKFGTTRASTVEVNSPTSISATAPAGSSTVDVTVTTGGGTSATNPADQFTYSPTVTAVSPPSGPTAGGTAVTITGTGFTGATAVNFGTTAATSFTVVSPTEITATSPKGTAGSANVAVTTPAGTSAVSVGDQFFYGPPTVSSIAPDAGPTAGGTAVTVTGTGFGNASAVKFGSTPATSFTVVSPTQLTAVAPAGSGLTHVVVTTNGGSSSRGGKTNEFTYNAAPSVGSVSPDSGPAAGGTNVTITGANFSGANAVTFGSTPVTSYSVVSPTEITAVTPSGSGTVDVTVSSASGTSATGPNDVFAYGAPTVTAVAPNVGSTVGGDNVVITGTGFVVGTTVKFGTLAATSVTITSPTSITAVSPPQSAGAVGITVTTPGGTSATNPSDVFTYSAGDSPGQGSLTITNPSSGASWSNLYVTIVLARYPANSNSGLNNQPASNVTISYEDSSGNWCPLTASGTGTITAYFSGIGSSCGSAPGSFSLASGASLTVPIQISYASGAYLGLQGVTATLYSGTCSSPTSCTQSGAINGTVVGTGSYQVAPLGTLAATVKNTGTTNSEFQQGFLVEAEARVQAVAPPNSVTYPTGTVEYLVDGTPVALTSSGYGTAPASNPATLGNEGYASKAYFSTADLSVGVHTLTLVYSGDGTFAPTTSTQGFTVLPAPIGTPYVCTSSSLSAGVTTLGYVTATSGTPPPTPSGTNAQVGGITVSLNLDPLSTAARVFTYSSSSNNSTTFTLSSGGSVSAPGNGTRGTDLVTWTGMSASFPVSGQVGSSFPVSLGSMSASLVNAIATETAACAPVSTGAQITSVPIAGNTLSVSPSASASPGAAVTLTDTVNPANPTPNGQVIFYDGTTDLGSVPVDYSGDAGNGTATYTTNTLAAGDHQLSAVWSGGGGVPANTSNTVDYQVGTSSTTSLASSANPANAANPVTFTATVNGSSGSPQPTGDVNFTVDGNAPAACQNVALSTASPPTATCKLSLKAGTTHSVVATYSGDATYLSSSSDPLSQSMLPGTTSTLTTAKNPAPAGNVTFWDGVAASAGGAVPTGTVAFTVDSKPYAACTHRPLGPGGGASCTLSFKAGTTHTVSATYPGSSSYSGSTSNTISLKVNGASSSTKPQATTGSATLASGKTLTANQSITTGSYKLVMQSDGNLVEYQGSKARWASGTSGYSGTSVVMQKDGNLVIYSQGTAIWASKTAGHAGSHLTLQASDGNVVIYTPAGNALWSTGT